MDQAQVHKNFIFNPKIDEGWLHGMYEYDYAYILEVFGNGLDTIREEMPGLCYAFESDDVNALAKSVHKLKPIFGFAALLDHQELAARFENSCASANNTANLTMQYIELIETINDAKGILQAECKKLKAFIA